MHCHGIGSGSDSATAEELDVTCPLSGVSRPKGWSRGCYIGPSPHITNNEGAVKNYEIGRFCTAHFAVTAREALNLHSLEFGPRVAWKGSGFYEKAREKIVDKNFWKRQCAQRETGPR